MNNIYFRLDENKNVIPCDLDEAEKLFNFPEGRNVRKTILNKAKVSTIFLVINHDLLFSRLRPEVFESMVFSKNPKYEYQDRYSSWKDAEIGHQKIVDFLIRKYDMKIVKDNVSNKEFSYDVK